MKLTVVGAGSTYTPGLVLRWLETKRDRIPIDELCLYDIDPGRLETIYRFVEPMLRAETPGICVRATTDRRDALTGAAFVVLQIRVGLNQQRLIDEHICVKHGFVGQETTGPGGFALALRQIPAAVDIARDVSCYAPDAWLISVANPAGVLAEALIKHGHVKTIGMCHGGFFPRAVIARQLGVQECMIEFDYLGLNHLGWIPRIYVGGKRLPDDRLAELAAAVYAEWNKFELNLPPEFARDFCPPFTIHHYLTYFYLHDEALAEMRTTGRTRADTVLEIERECLDYYEREAGRRLTPPPALTKRGGAIEETQRGNYGAVGYSDGCLGVIDALIHPEPQRLVVNVLNEGSITDLPADAAVEVSAIVSNLGVSRLNLGPLPVEVRAQVAAVQAYETMTVEAALTGDRRRALAALLSHPFCQCRYRATKALLEELLEANRMYLPAFFK